LPSPNESDRFAGMHKTTRGYAFGKRLMPIEPLPQFIFQPFFQLWSSQSLQSI
jgi:hypothetical protein